MTDSFVKKLIDNRLINIQDYIINNYLQLGLEEQSAMLLLHIYNLSKTGNDFLSVKLLQNKMTLNFNACADLVYKLVQNKLIAFEIAVDENGKTKEKFTLEPMYQKILNDLMDEKESDNNNKNENNAGIIMNMIEQEFGRTLSSFEIQIISSWIHDYQLNIDLIKLAIKEAIISRAYNIKYIDRILLTWQQKNIDSVEKAREYTKTFKRYENNNVKNEANQNQEVYVSWMK